MSVRRELTDAEIQSRFRTTRKSTSLPEIADADVPAGAVLMEVRENVRLSDPWNRDRTRITTRWTQPAAAITGLPRKYMDGGLIADRTNPSVLRMRVSMNVPEVTTQFLIRSRSSARLLIDGKEVASLKQALMRQMDIRKFQLRPSRSIPRCILCQRAIRNLSCR